jgi:chromosomal replication initiator protein
MPQEDRDTPDLHHLGRAWGAVSAAARRELSEVTYHVWLAPLEPAAITDGVLYVRAPDTIRTWVSERYAPLLRDAAREANVAAAVELVAPDWQPQPASSDPLALESASALNPRYTFDQFVICDGNRLAHAAALAVAEMPGQAYNPLFLHGPPGLGKTHLLHAIGNYVRTYGLGLSLRYATVEHFTADFVRSIRDGSTRAFRDRFRETNVLLIDDVQFLADKLRTEEEFFHTFNALYEAGGQLVISSDRPPRDIGTLESRLRERFEHGLVAELEPPTFEARLAILEKRARLDAVGDVDHATLAEIAHHVSASVRSLEGALIRVVAYASLRGEPPTPQLAHHVLERLYPRDTPDCTLDGIKAAASDALGVPPAALDAHDRRPKVAFARQVAMYLARELTDETLPAIGRSFGGRNHSTVLHAHRRIAADIGRDDHTADVVATIRSAVTGARDDRD